MIVFARARQFLFLFYVNLIISSIGHIKSYDAFDVTADWWLHWWFTFPDSNFQFNLCILYDITQDRHCSSHILYFLFIYRIYIFCNNKQGMDRSMGLAIGNHRNHIDSRYHCHQHQHRYKNIKLKNNIHFSAYHEATITQQPALATADIEAVFLLLLFVARTRQQSCQWQMTIFEKKNMKREK